MAQPPREPASNFCNPRTVRISVSTKKPGVVDVGRQFCNGNKIASEIRAEVAAEAKRTHRLRLRPGLGGRARRPQPGVRNLRSWQSKEQRRSWSLQRKAHAAGERDHRATTRARERSHRRDEIDGNLVQLPLPPQVDSKRILLAVDPAKDVDGFHPMNVGFLSTQRPGLVLAPERRNGDLRRSGIPIAGKEAVVVGRSDIVGKPMAMLLLNADATVTVCHLKTRDLPAVSPFAPIFWSRPSGAPA